MLDLKQLAVDIVDGKVFGSWMIPEADQHLLAAIFLPFAFKDAKGKLPEDVWGVYEYRDKAKKLGVREYPAFISCKLLTRQDCLVLNPLMERYAAFKTDFLAPADVSLPNPVAQSDS
jgi:hypothetical protein